ncbi:MAG TPA: hypothetical protein VE548_00120 [Nitrososphaeraceae archaeon]|nr:hypothetical protein [Nitrososphaeraceae archaeon]
MKSLDDELGPSLHKLEKKLRRQGLEIKKRKGVELVPDKEFSEIIENIILPIMIEYEKFLVTKQENVYLNCAIEKPNQLHEGITFELKDSIQISKQHSVRRITFFSKKERVHIFEEGTLGDGHPVELSYTKNEITEEFVRKKLTALIKEYVDKLLTAFK